MPLTPSAAMDARQQTRFAGGLLGVGCLAVVVAIVTHLASGATKMVGAPMERTAEILADGATGFTVVGLLSIPANFAIIVAALMLAHTRNHSVGRVPAAALWYTLAVGYLFALLYDMALPFLLIPLAADYAANPVVFEGLYRTFDLIHSGGLFMSFLAVALLFRGEMTSPEATLPRWWSTIGVIAALAGAALMASFLTPWPLVFLGPGALLTWATLAFVGFRIARGPGRKVAPVTRATGA